MSAKPGCLEFLTKAVIVITRAVYYKDGYDKMDTRNEEQKLHIEKQRAGVHCGV